MDHCRLFYKEKFLYFFFLFICEREREIVTTHIFSETAARTGLDWQFSGVVFASQSNYRLITSLQLANTDTTSSGKYYNFLTSLYYWFSLYFAWSHLPISSADEDIMNKYDNFYNLLLLQNNAATAGVEICNDQVGK